MSAPSPAPREGPRGPDPEDRRQPGPSHRALAYGAADERLVQAAERQAQAAARTPTSLETFALSTVSSATALVLGGAILIVVADVVNLVDGVDIWPLVTLAIALAAAASIALVFGYRRRAEDLLRTVAAPWNTDARFDRMEAKLDELMARETERRALTRGRETESE